jgi:hypothetical protein
MIESKERQVFGNHVVDIGRGQEYGYVQVTVATNAFKVTVYDQFDRPIKEDIYPILRNLTAEEIAFMDAYNRNVSGASPTEIEAFLRAEDHDKFCEEYGLEYYTGLADARGVWKDALAYAEDPSYFAK